MKNYLIFAAQRKNSKYENEKYIFDPICLAY